MAALTQGEAVQATASDAPFPGALKTPEHLAVRVFVLIALLVLLHSWTIAHFGVALKALLPVEVAIGIAATIGSFLRKREQVKVNKALRGPLFWLLRTDVLACAALLFLLAGSFVGSMVVRAAGAENLGVVKLLSGSELPIDRGLLNGAAAEERFFVATTPFGRAVSLRIDGHQRHTTTIYPWIPKRVQVPLDIRLEPSLLLRVPPEVVRFMPKPRFELYHGGALVAKVDSMPEGSLSMMVGPERRIAHTQIPVWEREVRAKTSGSVDRIIGEWLSPVSRRAVVPIEPGMRLRARIVGMKAPLAEKSFSVTSEPLQDILLIPLPAAKDQPPQPEPEQPPADPAAIAPASIAERGRDAASGSFLGGSP